MPSDSPPAAIYSLNNDVLSRIFEFNGDMFEDYGSLHITCRTSQVCRQWRDLMLDTPSLWAKLIDVDHICKRRTHEWRNELVRRSGAALLWIRAEEIPINEMGHAESHVKQFFFEVMTGNWHRIQRLTVSTISDVGLNLPMLSFPAPHLEEFTGPYTWDLQEAIDPPQPLFANHAPKLRSVNASRCFLHLQSAWLSDLHSITLDDTFCLSDALFILSATHRLQVLRFMDIPIGDMNSPRPIVSLPHLQDLSYFSDSCNAGVVLLNGIAIPASCSISVNVTSFINRESLLFETPFLFSIIEKFIQLAERAFQSYTFNSLDFGHPHKDHVYFQCNTPGPEKRRLRISVPLVPDHDGNILRTFFTKLRLLNLSRMRMLNFTAHGRLDSCFGLFFSCLPSLTTISTDLQTLSHLSNFQKEFTKTSTEAPCVIFPILRVINLFIYPGSPQSIFFVNQVAGAFLVSRWRAGFPITLLDMSFYPPLKTAPNLQALGDVKGLAVMYRLLGVEGVLEHTYGARTEGNVSM